MNLQKVAPNQNNKKNTPYQKLKNTKTGKWVRKHPVKSGLAAVGGAAVTAGFAITPGAVGDLTVDAFIPLASVGVSALGGAVAHDGFVNDWSESKTKATAKMALGTVTFLGGAEVAGRIHDIPVAREALSGTVFEHFQSLLGAGLVAGATVAGKTAYNKFSQISQSENKLLDATIGTGAAAGTAAMGLGGIQMIGQDLRISGMDEALTKTIEFLAETPAASVAGGALIATGGLVAAKQVVDRLKSGENNDYLTTAYGSGAAVATLGGAQLVGHGLNFEGTEGLLTDNADTIGGLSLMGLGGAMVKHAATSIKKDGLTPTKALGLTAGTAVTGSGLMLTAESLAEGKVTEHLMDATVLAGGLGLGYSSYAFGKKAAASFKEGRYTAAVYHGAGAAATAAGGLTAIGQATGIDALKQVGDKIIDVTIEPLTEHIVGPTLEFMVTNPVAGALALGLAIGGAVYFTKDKGDGGDGPDKAPEVKAPEAPKAEAPEAQKAAAPGQFTGPVK